MSILQLDRLLSWDHIAPIISCANWILFQTMPSATSPKPPRSKKSSKKTPAPAALAAPAAPLTPVVTPANPATLVQPDPLLVPEPTITPLIDPTMQTAGQHLLALGAAYAPAGGLVLPPLTANVPSHPAAPEPTPASVTGSSSAEDALSTSGASSTGEDKRGKSDDFAMDDLKAALPPGGPPSVLDPTPPGSPPELPNGPPAGPGKTPREDPENPPGPQQLTLEQNRDLRREQLRRYYETKFASPPDPQEEGISATQECLRDKQWRKHLADLEAKVERDLNLEFPLPSPPPPRKPKAPKAKDSSSRRKQSPDDRHPGRRSKKRGSKDRSSSRPQPKVGRHNSEGSSRVSHGTSEAASQRSSASQDTASTSSASTASSASNPAPQGPSMQELISRQCEEAQRKMQRDRTARLYEEGHPPLEEWEYDEDFCSFGVAPVFLSPEIDPHRQFFAHYEHRPERSAETWLALARDARDQRRFGLRQENVVIPLSPETTRKDVYIGLSISAITPRPFLFQKHWYRFPLTPIALNLMHFAGCPGPVVEQARKEMVRDISQLTRPQDATCVLERAIQQIMALEQGTPHQKQRRITAYFVSGLFLDNLAAVMKEVILQDPSRAATRQYLVDKFRQARQDTPSHLPAFIYEIPQPESEGALAHWLDLIPEKYLGGPHAFYGPVLTVVARRLTNISGHKNQPQSRPRGNGRNHPRPARGQGPQRVRGRGQGQGPRPIRMPMPSPIVHR